MRDIGETTPYVIQYVLVVYAHYYSQSYAVAGVVSLIRRICAGGYLASIPPFDEEVFKQVNPGLGIVSLIVRASRGGLRTLRQ